MKRICVVTGTRAEYGLLRPLMRAIDRSPNLTLQLVVTGTHLSEQHGATVLEIENDGFDIDRRVPILGEADSGTAIADAVGRAVSGIAVALADLDPDIVVLLGDRYEALAAGIAAMLCRKPIAHIHGGEATTGLIDEAIRHSLTKMSHLHFVSAEGYRQRVLQLGEHPEQVWCTGAVGLDGISELDLLSKEQLEIELGLRFSHANFLVTFHPVTLRPGMAQRDTHELIAALDRFPDSTVIATMPNAESESSDIRRLIQEWAELNPERVQVFESLGQHRYLSTLRVCDVVIGNSSSGLIEAPAVGTPTVNIGDRQRGRLRGSSVFDVAARSDLIAGAIADALAMARETDTASYSSPYGAPGASDVIVEVLERCNTENLLIKDFIDWGDGCALR